MANINIKKTLAIIILLILSFIVGLFIGKTYFPKTETTVIHDGESVKDSIHLGGDMTNSTDTIIRYRTKPIYVTANGDNDSGASQSENYTPSSNSDIDMNLGKPEVSVTVNGKEIQFKKQDDEKYVFDKGQLQVRQQSKASFDVHVDPIHVDDTKHFGAGVGVNSDGKLGVMATVPVHKDIDGWVYHDDDKNAGGVMLRF